MNLKLLMGLLIALMLACQVEDISIEVVKTADVLEFVFRQNGSKDTVDLIEIQIVDVFSGRIAWELVTFDPATIYEEKDGAVVLKKLETLPVIQAIPLARLRFGTIPVGFRQSFPRGNGLPALEKSRKYEIRVYGGAHRGRTEFEIS